MTQVSPKNKLPQILTTDHDTIIKLIAQKIQLDVDNIPDMYMDVDKLPLKRRVPLTQKENENSSPVTPTKSLRPKTALKNTQKMGKTDL